MGKRVGIDRPISPQSHAQANSADGLPVADPDYGSSNPSTERQTVSICVDGGRGRNKIDRIDKNGGLINAGLSQHVLL